MKKRIITLLLALVMVASLVGTAVPAFADGGVTLRLHYAREDGNYEGWEMWFWDPAGTSPLDPPYQFVEENGEMVSTIQLKTGTMQVGFIVRLGNWEAKDIEADQFIDITGILSGTVDVYVKSGVEGYELVEGADVRGVVVTSAQYKEKNSDGNPQVIVKMSSKIEGEVGNDTFTVSNSDGAVAISAVKAVNSYYYLTLAEALNIRRGYNVTFEGNNYAVSMPDFYSSPEFEADYTYTGNDLGATYTAEKTTLRLWAPTAVSVNVNLFTNGDPAVQELPVEQLPMTQDVNGTWVCELTGDRNGTYYTYEVTTDTDVAESVIDPYARAAGVNGKRGMIIDLAATNPEGWDADANPNAGKNFTDAVIYELHVRDLTSDASSGASSANVGKYLGVIESGTTNSNGVATGLDHIVDLGVTHVHLLPVYDYGSVDETKLGTEEQQFNWGYDPVNYNLPEGSYSSDPYNGEVRVKEFKQMVKGMHEAGLSVIMDVVYNHVYNGTQFSVNQIVPGYFTRPGSNGSGCGNDVASERAMVSKYIVDSVNYWADEYHIDGFRFDLVGLIDTNTINEIVKTVTAKHPDVIFYGEGWTMNTAMTKTGYSMATQTNASKTPGFAYFSDTIRNLVKGGTFGGVSAGYISGGAAPSGDLNACFKGMPAWCPSPSQSVNYISCHDNNTLFDHITVVATGASEADKIAMNKLGVAFYMSAQGIPFFQAGEEILRSKPNGDGTFNENSYNAEDAVNSIKWDDLNKAEYMDVYEYYKGLIAFRKAHPALRLTTAAEVDGAVQAVTGLPNGVAAYNIAGGVNGETAEGIFCAFNAGKSAATVNLPEGTWNICVNADDAGIESLGTATGSIEVGPISSVILVKDSSMAPAGDETEPTEGNGDEATPPAGNEDENEGGLNAGLIIPLITVAVVAVAVIVVVVLKKKK